MTKDHQLGDAPIEHELHRQMVTMMQVMNEHFNGDTPPPHREFGIVLMMFPHGDGPGRVNFVSNGVDRADIVVLFKEMIARFEGQPDLEGHA